MDREAMQAHRVFRVFRGFVEKWGRKVTLAVKALKETWVPRAQPVLWVRPAQPDLREMPGHRVLEGFPDQPDLPVQLEPWGRREQPAHRAFRVKLVRLELKGLKDVREMKAQPEPMGQQEQREQPAQPEPMGQRERQVQPEPMAQREPRDLPVLPGLQV